MKLGGWLVVLTAMVIFTTILGLPTGLTPITKFVGITTNQTTGTVIGADIQSGSLFSRIFGDGTGILALLLLSGGVTIGLYIYTKDTSILVLPIITAVGTLYVSAFWGIILYVQGLNQGWLTAIITLIFGTMAVGFTWSTVDYFVGR